MRPTTNVGVRYFPRQDDDDDDIFILLSCESDGGGEGGIRGRSSMILRVLCFVCVTSNSLIQYVLVLSRECVCVCVCVTYDEEECCCCLLLLLLLCWFYRI